LPIAVADTEADYVYQDYDVEGQRRKMRKTVQYSAVLRVVWRSP
jgi:hypothetical protein